MNNFMESKEQTAPVSNIELIRRVCLVRDPPHTPRQG